MPAWPLGLSSRRGPSALFVGKPPLVAPDADGATKQMWAYDDHPFYLFVEDTKPGDITGDGEDGFHVAKADEELRGSMLGDPHQFAFKERSHLRFHEGWDAAHHRGHLPHRLSCRASGATRREAREEEDDGGPEHRIGNIFQVVGDFERERSGVPMKHIEELVEQLKREGNEPRPDAAKWSAKKEGRGEKDEEAEVDVQRILRHAKEFAEPGLEVVVQGNLSEALVA